MQYEVKALREPEGLALLQLDAVNEQAALQQVQTQGYRVLSVKAKQGWPTFSAAARFPVMSFSQELLALLEAGLVLVEAIETLAEKEARPEIKKVLTALLAEVYQGHPLSKAMEGQPDCFPPLYIATIRASEKTGTIAETLSRYIAYQSQIDLVRKKIVSASIYPVMLLGAGGLVMLFLMFYVVPKFSQVYADIGGDLPYLSQLLMQWGRLLAQHGPILILSIGAAIATVAFWLSLASTRQAFIRKLQTIPMVGKRIQLYQLARLYRTIGMLLRGGIPILKALEMSSGLLSNELRHHLDAASIKIQEGQPISLAMESAGLTTPVALRLLRVGERSGQMGEMMERLGGFYDEEMARWVDWFTKLFEPLLMTCIGLVIGVIVVLMYVPIFELAGSLQ